MSLKSVVVPKAPGKAWKKLGQPVPLSYLWAALNKGKLQATPILDHVAAISVGIVKGTPLLDLAYIEDSACDTDMNVVMTGSGGFVEVQGTAEGAPFSRAQMDALLGLAGQGIATLVQAQKQALGRA
jgi:ribonuclease PH